MTLIAYVFFPLLQESDYFTDRGEFRVDSQGSSTLLNCLMYKLSYYRFGELKVCILGSWLLALGYWVLSFGFWVLGLESWVLSFKYWVLSLGSWVLGLEFWVLGLGGLCKHTEGV